MVSEDPKRVKLSDVVSTQDTDRVCDEVITIKVGPHKDVVEVRQLRLIDYISLYDDLVKIIDLLTKDKEARKSLDELIGSRSKKGTSPDIIPKFLKLIKPIIEKLPAIIGRCISKPENWVKENCDLADIIEISANVIKLMDFGRIKTNFPVLRDLLKK